jgi:hypothetical protein
VISGLPTTAGTFNFTVIVTDTAGNTAPSGTLSIAVMPPTGAPTCQPPTLQVNSNTTNYSVTATSNCTDTSGTIQSTTFNWGDGTAVSLASGTPPTAMHSYTAPGTYPVTVIATDQSGLTATATTNITVVSPTSATQGQPAQFPPINVTAPPGVQSVTVSYTCTTVYGPNGQQSFNANQYGLTCSISPQTPTLTAGTLTPLQVTVSTAGSGSAMLRPRTRANGPGWLFATFLPIPAIVLLGIGMFPPQGCKRKLVRYAALLLVGALICCCLGCGNSISAPPTSVTLTPNGQYSVSITGDIVLSGGHGGTTTSSSTITVGFTVVPE